MPPRHRRHPLLRVLMGLLGLALLLVLVAASVFVGAAMLAIGLAVRLLRPGAAAKAVRAQSRVVEGECTVVDAGTIDGAATGRLR